MLKTIRMLLAALLASQPIGALADPLETFQLKDHIDVTGQALGTGRRYKITTSAARAILFTVNVDGACRYGLQKGAILDYQPLSTKFPAEFSDKATTGEVYILSFSQTRPAWQKEMPCSYSFSLK